MEERYGLLMCAQGILPVIHALEPESIVQKIIDCHVHEADFSVVDPLRSSKLGSAATS